MAILDGCETPRNICAEKRIQVPQELLYDWLGHKIAYHQAEMLKAMELQKELGQYGMASVPMEFMRKISNAL